MIYLSSIFIFALQPIDYFIRLNKTKTGLDLKKLSQPYFINYILQINN